MNILMAVVSLLLSLSSLSVALEPPDRVGMVFSNSHSWAKEDALELGNHLVSPGLVAGFKNRLSAKKDAKAVPSGQRGGLPAQGTQKILVLLIEFDEYPHKAVDTVEAMRDKIFHAGSVPPYESLSAYYRRSSYGKLNIEGNVLGWYNAGLRADIPQTREGGEALVKKVLQSYPEHDFSQYDNDNNGVIDYVAVIWTGPPSGWGTFWWGLKLEFSDKTFEVSGKKLASCSWLYAVKKWDDPEAVFMPITLIHETGHALGLSDYYDYKPGVGPDGGLGKFDMMESNKFDHNCFSKFLLGWVDPEVVTVGEFKLRPAGDSADCVLLAPPGWEKNPFSEFFLAENRRKTGNDADEAFPGGGLVIWHVDARLDPEGKYFLYDNSTTDHKLLKILESDGLEEIETQPKYRFGQDDFYTDGRAFGPETKPSSGLYDGTDTGINLLSYGGNYEAEFAVAR
jgi:M6 family metalloprotease-like protein